MESDLCVVLVTVFSFLVSKGKLNPERSNTNYRAPFFAFKKTTFQTKSRLFFVSFPTFGPDGYPEATVFDELAMRLPHKASPQLESLSY